MIAAEDFPLPPEADAPSPADDLPHGDFPIAEAPVVLQAAEPEPLSAWTPMMQGDYQLTAFDDWAERIEPARFQDPSYSPTLREMIARVIAREAPIRDDALVERIARAHGIRRSGRLVRERVISLARGAAHMEPEPGGEAVFVWPDAIGAESWSRARFPASESDIRPLDDIPLAELGAALRTCSAEDPETEAARRFGIRRLSAAGRQRLARARTALGHFAA